MAVVGLIFACIPGAFLIGWILLPVSFVLGIVGVALSGKKKGTSIAAIIVAVIGTIVGIIVFLAVISSAVDDAFSDDDLTAEDSAPPKPRSPPRAAKTTRERRPTSQTVSSSLRRAPAPRARATIRFRSVTR